MRASTAHLTVRVILHPVLARADVGSLPFRPLLRQTRIVHLIRDFSIRDDVFDVDPDVWPPNRRLLHIAPLEVPLPRHAVFKILSR